MSEKIERFEGAPTVEALQQIEGITPEQIDQIRAVLSSGKRHEKALQECDRILGNHGIESIEPEGCDSYTDSGIHLCPPFSYSNTGDSYALTIARDHEAGKWVLAGWADLLEEYEQEHKLGDHEEFEEEPHQCPSCGGHAFTLKFYPAATEVLPELLRSERTDNDTYSWICHSCNYHLYAVIGYEPSCTNCGGAIEGTPFSAGDTEEGPSPLFCSKACYEAHEWPETPDEGGQGDVESEDEDIEVKGRE